MLTFLTMPVDPHSDRPALQAAHMRSVKEALLDADALASLLGLLAGPLSRHPAMAEEDRLAVQLVLTFVRNLLAVPEAADSRSSLQVGASGGLELGWQVDIRASVCSGRVCVLLSPPLPATHVAS